ncbi:MAG: hypothetical protein JO022_12410 [Acidobacteriaceae bacterium]|nr:hypothetical protein [Acidobacteriaceae bacterium]
MQFENSGGIKRGDRADTGDLEARPTEGVSEAGSGVVGGEDDAIGHPTANPDSLGGTTSFDSSGVASLGGNGDLEDLTILDASDPSLGLTDVGEVPADDWAADTGPTHSGEESSQGVSRELVDEDRDFTGRKIDFDHEGGAKEGRK